MAKLQRVSLAVLGDNTCCAVTLFEDLMEGQAELLCTIQGHAGVITLNRPRVLNTLNMAMLAAMKRQLCDWSVNENVQAVVVRGAGTKAFCAGGDVRAVFDARGDDAFMDRVYRIEYELDEYISRYPKPYVALMSGYTMGGGCGISIHGKYRVVTDTTVMAMPEVAIGLFPDVAAAYFLSRCPGATGMYLGLTGARISGSDALYLGLADYFLKSESFDPLIALLADSGDVQRTLDKLAVPRQESRVESLRQEIDACFGCDSVANILSALQSQPGDWAREAAAAMLAAAPTSLEITFRALREGRGKSLRECLITDFRIAQRLMKQGDYFEGVRALIIDKDRQPKWSPPTLAEVDRQAIERCFSPLLPAVDSGVPQSTEMTFP